MWGRDGLLILTGRATPHSTVSAWRGQAALRYVNARLDGGWQMWLVSVASPHSTYASETELTVRTNLGEAISRQESGLSAIGATAYPPILLSPKEGELLENGQPVLLGLAQPASGHVKVNSMTVASLVADAPASGRTSRRSRCRRGEVAIAASAETAYRGDDGRPCLFTHAPVVSPARGGFAASFCSSVLRCAIVICSMLRVPSSIGRAAAF